MIYRSSDHQFLARRRGARAGFRLKYTRPPSTQGKHVILLDHAGYTAPTRQQDLLIIQIKHTTHTTQITQITHTTQITQVTNITQITQIIQIIPIRNLDHKYVGTDYLSEVLTILADFSFGRRGLIDRRKNIDIMSSRAYHPFEVWSDWLGVRASVALIGLGSGLGLLGLA